MNRAWRKRRSVDITAFALLVATSACGTSLQNGHTSLAALRAQAAMNPNDSAVVRRVALAELFASEGDPQSVDAALARALQLEPKSARLHFVSGIAQDAHGHPVRAFNAYLETLRLSLGSEDPIAPQLAELSVAAIAGLEGSVTGFVPKVRAAFLPLLDDARLPTPAHFSAASLLMHLAYRMGKRDEADALAARVGCVTSLRAAGPFGPRVLLGFDEGYGVQGGAALAARYDLGAGAGVQETRDLGARGCTVNVGGGPITQGGTTFAQAYVELSESGSYLVRLESPSNTELSIDGRMLRRIDRRARLEPGVIFEPIELNAGRHEVLLKLTTGHPNPAFALSLTRTRARDAAALALPFSADAVDGFPKYLRAASAAVRGDLDAARISLRGIDAAKKPAPLLAMLRASVMLGDPLYPSDQREDEARRLLGAARTRDPGLWSPALQLAAMMASNGRPTEAIAALRDANIRWPEVPTIGLGLVSLLTTQEWNAEADALVTKLRALVPDACAPLSAELDALRKRDREQAAATTVEALMKCESQANARYGLLLRQRRFDAAAIELERLAAFDPPQARYAWILARLELAKNRDDKDGIAKQIAALRAGFPRSENGAMEEIDHLAGRGERDPALTALTNALSHEPAAMAELHRLVPVLGGEHMLAHYRMDGRKAIAAFEASGRHYDAPQVLVFDYMAARIFEDGSSLELVHTIEKAQSDEAVDKLAEVQVPQGARILTLHTIKPDGQRLEPDEIAGKDEISLPTVSPGDYVEVEYIVAKESATSFSNGYLGDRFYFKSFEIPFDHSQMVMIVPKGMDAKIDPRGPAPALQEQEVDGLRVLTFKVDESKPLTPEPNSPSAREFLPSIRLSVHASWGAFVDSIRDVLVDNDVYDAEIAAQVKQLVGNAAPNDTKTRAERLYRWVLANIENTDDMFSQSALMVRGRAGNRARVLHYMLGLAGVPSRLALARSITSDATPSEMADSETYEHLLVALDDKAGSSKAQPQWLFTVERYAPFGYLPPALRGQPALMLDAQHTRVTLPGNQPGQSLRRVELDVALRSDGSAHIDVVETVHGQGAVSWRRELDSIPAAELEHRFEQDYASRLFTGARLSGLAIKGREQSAEAIVLRYGVDLSVLGRRVEHRWALPPMLASGLSQNFAQSATRTTDELLSDVTELDVVIHLHLAKGSAPPVPAAPVHLEAAIPGHPLFASKSRIDKDALVIERHLAMPQMRIAPKDYAAFTDFCRKVDAAESNEVLVDLR